MELTLQSSQQLLLHLNLPFNGLSGSKQCATWTAFATISIFPSSLSRYAPIEKNKHRVEPLDLAVIADPELQLQCLEKGFPQRGKAIWQEHLPQWRKTWGMGKKEEGILGWALDDTPVWNSNRGSSPLGRAGRVTFISVHARGSWPQKEVWIITTGPARQSLDQGSEVCVHNFGNLVIVSKKSRVKVKNFHYIEGWLDSQKTAN